MGGAECEENKEEVSAFIKALDKGEEAAQLEGTNHQDRRGKEAVGNVERKKFNDGRAVL